MATAAVFPGVGAHTGMYESFYLRAVSPREPLGVWIRNTVHKRAGEAPTGSVWCTIFDAAHPAPWMHKFTTSRLGVPASGWIEIGDSDGSAGEGGLLGPGRVSGRCGSASWSLCFQAHASELRHLPQAWLYRAPLPRTKLTSPAPAASFDGVIERDGDEPLQLSGWRGMVGHNWGAQHAERWIWLHGIGFDGAPDAWLDLAIGRVALAGRTTPWIANGMLCVDGRSVRLGGLFARGTSVAESAAGCEVTVAGAGGARVRLRATVPAGTAAGWRYADPDGGEHDVVHSSIAAMTLEVSAPGDPVRTLESSHGATYELGMRERDHGVPIAPFPDG